MAEVDKSTSNPTKPAISQPTGLAKKRKRPNDIVMITINGRTLVMKRKDVYKYTTRL